MRLPPYGKFTIKEQYSFEYYIDAVEVIDDFGETIILSDCIFKTCFEDLGKTIKSYNSKLLDDTIYHVYLIICTSNPNLDEIKAYAKIKHVNFIEAKKMLIYGRNLLSSGNAYSTENIVKKLGCFQVNYKIEPTFPYEELCL